MSVHTLLKDPPSSWTDIVTNSHKVYQHQTWTGLTTAERDSFTPEQGMIIFNNTVTRFQGYWNGLWRNLGDEGDAATVPVIVSKSGSGTGNFTAPLTDGTTGTSIDAANLDHTVTIPIGYKLTCTAVVNVTSFAQSLRTQVFFYDGGTNGAGGNLIVTSTLNGVEGGSGQTSCQTLYGIIEGDDLEHEIHLMVFSITGGNAAVIYNDILNNRLVVPKVTYRLEKAL